MSDRDNSLFDAVPLDVLREINSLCLAFEKAWRDGQSPRIEDFANRMSGDAHVTVLRELIAQEVDLRRAAGQSADVDEYHQRFPHHAQAVRNAFSLLEKRPSSDGKLSDTMSFLGDDVSETDDHSPQADSKALKHDEPPAPQVLGRFEIKRRLGRGAFGDVFLAYDPQLDRLVALKVPRRERFTSSEDMDIFVQEARTAAGLTHPGIVTIYDVVPDGDLLFIVQEYVEGQDLAKYLKSQSTGLAAEQAVDLLKSIAEALSFAHQKGFVHRDLKPANILLDAQLRPRVADFGLAVHETVQWRRRGERSGTPAYMSPEQVRGETHLLDGRSDIWSLGVVLYQCLTGRPPFSGATFEAICEEILKREPKPLRQIDDRIPKRLEEICLKCLSKSVSDRYATGKDLEYELNQWATESAKNHPESGKSVTPQSSEELVDSIRRAGRRFAFAVAISTMCGLLIAAYVGFSASNNRELEKAGAVDDDLRIPMLPSSAVPVAAENVQQNVLVITRPANARIVVYPIRAPYGFLDRERRVEAEQRSPATLQLLPGNYLVVAALDGGRFHEVYRSVPANPHRMPPSRSAHIFWRNRADGSIEWPEINIPAIDVADEMGLFEGAENFLMGSSNDPEIPKHNRSVASFYLDTHEVAWGEFLSNNRHLPPPSLLNLKDKLPEQNLAIAGIWYHDAVSYAEKIGKRLPTEAEYEFAATVGGTRRFPWGDDASVIRQWTLGAVGTPEFDHVDAGRPVYGLYSNVAEWTSSWASAYPPIMDYLPGMPSRPDGSWIVRGAPYSVIIGSPEPDQFSNGPRSRIGQPENELQPGLGFRCARSAHPRLDSSQLERFVPE